MLASKLIVLLLSVIVIGLYKTTHAELIDAKNNVTNIKNKENKTVIELNKDITVNTDSNLDKAIAQLNGTEASNVAKIRKVTLVDNDSLERKSKSEQYAKEGKSAKTTVKPLQPTNISTEAGVVEIKAVAENAATNILGVVQIKENNATISNQASVNTTDPNLTVNTKVVAKPDKNNSTPSLTTKKPASANTTVAATKPIVSVASNSTKTNITTTVVTLPNLTEDSRSSSPTTSSTTTSTTTKTTTSTPTTITTPTRTTTPKPKKPTITYSVPDFPDLEKDNPELKNFLQANKLPLQDGPYAQPSQEFNGNFHRGRDLILPIVSMVFIIPLVIGIIITSYRRFRDCWSTRHYRRMDFLVDGMYND